MSGSEVRAPELFQHYVSRHEQTRIVTESGVSDPRRNAMFQAKLEEKRRSKMEATNSKRLRMFQRAVDSRVRRMEGIKLKEERRQTERCVEGERRALEQSCAIRQPSVQSDGCGFYDCNTLGVKMKERQAKNSRDFDTSLHSIETDHQSSADARKELLSRVANAREEKVNELPGGLWREHVTSSKHPTNTDDVMDICDDETTSSACYDVERHDDVTSCDGVDAVGYDAMSGDALGDDHWHERRVGFRDDVEVIEEETTSGCEDGSGSELDYLERVRANMLFPEKQKDLEKKQACCQFVTFRRLYMNTERERVRQRRKEQQHKLHVQRLKHAKEDTRRIVERQLTEHSAPQDPLTGQPAALVQSAERREDMKVRRVLEKRQRHVEKMRDNARFIDALRAQLQEKLKHQRVTLPRLCGCGPSFWDSHPLTCANNCVFYRNPRAYARAVTSLLATLDTSC